MDYASKNIDIGMIVPEKTENKSLDSTKKRESRGNSNCKKFEQDCERFIPIKNPYKFCYLDATDKIDISDIDDFTLLNSVTDGTQTLTFDSTVQKRQVPDSWLTWSEPPYSESSTPAVLFEESSQLTINLSKPSKVFGIEIEPNVLEEFDISVEFYSGIEIVGTIFRTVDGNAGARLFAAAYSSLPFDSIIIRQEAGGRGFAIAQLRYGDGIECNLYCTNKCIPFKCKIETEENVLKITKGRLDNFNLDVDCEISQCYTKPKIKICDQKLDCDLPCVPIDILYINGTAQLLLSVKALVDSPGSEPRYVRLTCTTEVDICQTCFACEGEGDCEGISLVLKCIRACINCDNDIILKGIVKFICPNEDCK